MSQPTQRVITPFNERQFREALSQFATGITVVTTRSDNGEFFGVTISSFNSVSLDPPLVLWSLATKARSLSAFKDNTHYVINVLSADQQALAERFASRTENRFDGLEIELSHSGLPILKGAAAWFECRNRSCYPEGDHLIFVGEVEDCDVSPQDALVFHAGRFVTTK